MTKAVELCLLCAAAVMMPEAAQSQAVAQQATEASAPLQMRVAELVAILDGRGAYDQFFSDEFQRQVPKAQFDAISAQLKTALGPIVGVQSVSPVSPHGATVVIAFRDGTATMRIAVDSAAPHRVEGLLITGTSTPQASLDEVLGRLSSLPGSTSFALARLGGKEPELLRQHNANQPAAVGSAFKLIILAELVRAVDAGERKWTDVATLDGNPLPGGAYTQSPKGTAVTLKDLAARMISVSDNSATDILLHHLGRERVEAMLPRVGIKDPAGMRPFLSTLELFKLKSVQGGALGARYAALNEAGRRAMLAREVRAEPIEAIDPKLFQDGRPIMIDKLEWFASAADMVRVMDWLRRNTERDATGRTILGLNPGIGGAAADGWQYVGYKGGSEPGVINMTLLLKAKDGGWYALASSWNNPQAAVSDLEFASLVSRAAELSVPGR